MNLFQFNVEALPHMVAYIPNKEMYSTLIGTFDLESIKDYLGKVVAGRVPFNNIPKSKIVIDSKVRCQDIVDAVDSNSNEEDDIMKEILAERQKQEDAANKLKEDEAKNNKKKRKGKKKKKKAKKSDL